MSNEALFLKTRSCDEAMPVRMEEFFKRTASRKWSMIGTTREERKMDATVVPLYGSPVTESKSRYQTRREEVDAEKECCGLLNDIVRVFEKFRFFLLVQRH
ncbi:hypothetical protein ROZALSC1DRAFT_26026 [Rozella allomycis CSF55]|uniref:Uncharacterized protein n=1 Tax=Rozella allomycis (strain CSF55) TaxID=988480 RepID=A0A4P9Y9D6_ROZAC|nr:hypothetical protein ROZALSC1DRAFT_26026 [Rozella allomycis CSF55]